MSFRTVIVEKANKISYKNRFLVVKDETDEKYVHLSEIDTLIIDSLSISISGYLLQELSKNKINVIFCDEKHNPYGELESFYNCHNSSKHIICQTKWTKKEKDILWKKIIRNKILNQMLLLKKIKSSNYDLLLSYINEISDGDKTNREAHASKVYFNSLFGKNFIRNSDDNINTMLNYGYAVLLSNVNKEVIKNGFITQVGINHKNEYNQFNLSCDLMEPFRVVIDNFVYYNKEKEFNSEMKKNIINIFNKKYRFCKKQYTLKDIINLYIKQTLCSVNDGSEYKEFIFYEESNNENDSIF